jgi:hypothetical protein
MVTGTAYNTFFYILCWDTTGYVYIYGLRRSPPRTCPAGLGVMIFYFTCRVSLQEVKPTEILYIYMCIYCNWDMFLYTYKYIYIIYICNSMWIMIVSFLSLDVQLMHDEDQDVIEGSRGDIARIWYWQVVRVKIIDRKFGLFFSGPPPKKNASEDSYPNFEPWPCVCVWKCRRPNCQWQLWGNICWYIISFRIGGTLS